MGRGLQRVIYVLSNVKLLPAMNQLRSFDENNGKALETLLAFPIDFVSC